MKFTYALGNEFFFGHKLCLAADFAVVPSSVIGRGSDLHRVVFFILQKTEQFRLGLSSKQDRLQHVKYDWNSYLSFRRKTFCLYDDTFIKCLLFIHNSVGSRPGLFALESDLIYHFVGLESIRIFAYILLCIYFYGLSLYLSIRWPYKILLQSTKVELFI